jgi:FkbM family methyltransferase
MINKILKIIVGKKKYQKLFELLYQFSLQGMNVGGENNPAFSGEQYALAYINKKLYEAQNLIVFDVGANVGQYSILLNDVFGNRARIYSFEPSMLTFEKLKSNTSNLTNIYIQNFGFGEKYTKSILFSNDNESSLASLYKRNLNHFNITMNINEEIDLKTIDGFCYENEIQRINLLKLDIEGHEISSLNGASRIINSGNIDFIQFEFGGCNIDSKTYFQDFYYMLNDKYKIYRIVKDGLFEINQYKEMYEIFITTNFLAEKRLNF